MRIWNKIVTVSSPRIVLNGFLFLCVRVLSSLEEESLCSILEQRAQNSCPGSCFRVCTSHDTGIVCVALPLCLFPHPSHLFGIIKIQWKVLTKTFYENCIYLNWPNIEWFHSSQPVPAHSFLPASINLFLKFLTACECLCCFLSLRLAHERVMD